MSKAQRYNKIISFKPLLNEEDKTSDFDLSYLTYNGKLTLIVEKFNHKNSSIENSQSLVQEAESNDQGHNPLQIASFLNFSIFSSFNLTARLNFPLTISKFENPEFSRSLSINFIISIFF